METLNSRNHGEIIERGSETRPLVLYMAGDGRSGSTLLAAMLDQITGFFAAGELMALWRRGLRPTTLCGCESPAPACPLWKEIFTRFFASHPELSDGRELMQLQHATSRLRHTPKLLWAERYGATWEAAHRYRQLLGELYVTIAEVTGAKVIVDSSKLPSGAALLDRVAQIEPYLLHLVRDPRGVACSKFKKGNPMQPQAAERILMPVASQLTSARTWILLNTLVEMVRLGYGKGKSVRVRYEDLVASPDATLRRIMDLLGYKADLEFVQASEVSLAPNHMVWGNSARFRTGMVELKQGDAWARDMSRGQRLLSIALTAPLSARYGYWVSQRKAGS